MDAPVLMLPLGVTITKFSENELVLEWDANPVTDMIADAISATSKTLRFRSSSYANVFIKTFLVTCSTRHASWGCAVAVAQQAPQVFSGSGNGRHRRTQLEAAHGK